MDNKITYYADPTSGELYRNKKRQEKRKDGSIVDMRYDDTGIVSYRTAETIAKAKQTGDPDDEWVTSLSNYERNDRKEREREKEEANRSDY